MQKSLFTKGNFLALIILTFLFIQPNEVFSQKRSNRSTSITTKDGRRTIHITDNNKDFRIEYEGDVTLSDDDKDIIAITEGGFIEITKSSFGNRRRILIESDRTGNLIRKYYVNHREKDYNPEGKSWLAEILTEVVRTTTIAAKTRVDRFYNRGGVNAVFNEVGKMESDHVKSAYLKLLLKKNLNNNELIGVIDHAAQKIGSDHYLSQILKSNQKAFLANSQTTDAYIKASKSLGSDHYKTQILKTVINDNSMTDSNLGTLLKMSEDIGSDHYISQIVFEIMRKRDLNSQNISQILALSKEIGSDHYRSQIVKKIINEENMSSTAYNELITIMDDIGSDHYIVGVLKQLWSKRPANDAESFDNLLGLVNKLSDHYAGNFYKSIAGDKLSEDQLVKILNAAADINSDSRLSSILVALSNQVNRSSDRAKDAYKRAAKTIRSETYYGRVLKALN